jgi:hypothetical protein
VHALGNSCGIGGLPCKDIKHSSFNNFEVTNIFLLFWFTNFFAVVTSDIKVTDINFSSS